VSNKKYSGWAYDDLHKFSKCYYLVATERATPLRKKLEEKFKTSNKYHCMINEIEPASCDEVTKNDSPNSVVVPYTDLLGLFNGTLSTVVTPHNLSKENEEFDPALYVPKTEMEDTQAFLELLGDTVQQHVAV